MFNLKLPDSGKISQIIHISDIHIRVGDLDKSRVVEYNIVFNNLINDISKLNSVKNKSAVVVITGDLFESKNKLDSFSIQMFNKIVKDLSNLLPVYLIQGNHDYRQDKPEIPDVISSMLSGNNNDNICYMSKTGNYLAGDVGFGLVHIQDVLLSGSTSGQTTNLIEFPNVNKFPKCVKKYIALFHGTIKYCTMQNYTLSDTGFPLEWFKDYHLGLFGDIHLQKVYNSDNGKFSKDKITWGYSGSLIQQNFGESLYGHGYLLWDLEVNNVSKHHIYNPYGMMYVKYINDSWYGYINLKEVKNLNELLSEEYVPYNLIISIRGQSNSTNMQELEDIFINKNKKFKITKTMFNSDIDTDINMSPENIINMNNSNDIIDLYIYNSPHEWCKYIKHQINNDNDNDKKIYNLLTSQNWEQLILYPDTLYVPKDLILNDSDSINKHNERNNNIDKCILIHNEKMNVMSQISRSRLKLKYMKWEWMFCYGKNNYIDFTTLDKNVCIIKGSNDAGKSSFLEIICYALFGNGIPSRCNDKHPCHMICNEKPDNETSGLEIEFLLGNELYSIERIYSKKDNKLIQKKQTLKSFNILENKWINIKDGNVSIKEWVNNNIGKIEEFLMSSMLTQNSDKDFFSLDSQKQLEIFENALNLDSVNTLMKILNESVNAHKYFNNIYTNRYSGLQLEFNDLNINSLEIDIFNLKSKLYTLNTNIQNTKTNYDNIKETWHSYDINDILLDINTINDNINTYNISPIINVSYETLKINESIIISQIEECRELISNNNFKYVNLNHDDIINFSNINIEEMENHLVLLKDIIPEKP